MGLGVPAVPGTVALAVVRPTRLRWPLVLAGVGVVVVAAVVGVLIGPAALPAGGVVRSLLDRLPLVDVASGLTETQEQILWQVRLPRVVLAGLVGAALAGAGAAYQGVFRNPLADPYLLGVAAGAGLGATFAFVYGPGGNALVPLAAFLGALVAVTVTYVLGSSAGRGATPVVLAGVAVASFFTAIQTYVQQRHATTLRQVYSWILGSLGTATWSEVRLILPYVLIASAGLLAHRRLLDVLRVGDDEAGTLGVPTERLRLTVVVLATVGTAAAVSVSGLIAFVGIIVPHTVRLLAGASYRLVLPLSLAGGAGFLILADVLARSIDAPAEIPIGVVTACFGAPFFLIVLKTRSRA